MAHGIAKLMWLDGGGGGAGRFYPFESISLTIFIGEISQMKIPKHFVRSGFNQMYLSFSIVEILCHEFLCDCKYSIFNVLFLLWLNA